MIDSSLLAFLKQKKTIRVEQLPFDGMFHGRQKTKTMMMNKSGEKQNLSKNEEKERKLIHKTICIGFHFIFF